MSVWLHLAYLVGRILISKIHKICTFGGIHLIQHWQNKFFVVMCKILVFCFLFGA